MIFTFSFSAVSQENISDGAVDLVDTTFSELVTAKPNCCISKSKFVYWVETLYQDPILVPNIG